MQLSAYHHSFDLFCKVIGKKNASILELACGPGNITAYLLSKHPEYTITATDLSEKMLERAKANNPAAHTMLLDCRDIGKLSGKYDAIMFGFGLPYISKTEAVQFIADAAHVLNKGGVLYISTMEDDNSKSGYRNSSDGKDSIYMNYHEARYLTEALHNNGFKIVLEHRQPYNEPDGSVTTDLILVTKLH